MRTDTAELLNWAKMPYMLRRLYERQESINDFIVGGADDTSDNFELLPKIEDGTDWFHGDNDAGSYFVNFAMAGGGEDYGFCLYDDRTLETAPIVFMGHGQEQLLANTVEDFVALLTVGFYCVGTVGMNGKFGDPIRVSEKLLSFRSWVLSEFGITVPDNPKELIKQAQQSHPDLEKWIDQWPIKTTRD